MAEDAFVTDFEHIMADDITDDVRFIMYDSASGKTASAGEVSKYMMRNIHVDSTLTEEGSAAEAKAVGDALTTKADTKGRYEDIVAGGAEQLMADGYESDSDPYLFRPTGGSADVGNREYLDKIVGGTVGWNQLCNGSSVTVQNGRKYLLKKGTAWSIGASTGTAITGLTSGSDMVINLTAMFGTTIADYIYSLEQATAGAGVAWFRNYFPKDYYHYDKGTLRSVEGVSAHETVGFNQWDEEWEVGSIRVADGTPSSSITDWRGKNYIGIFPRTNYHIHNGGTATQFVVYYYDADKNYLNYAFTTATSEYDFATPSDAHYMKFVLYQASTHYGMTYHNNICINISSSENGTYKPYEGHTYPLDSSLTLRGVPKLVDGKLAFDGDVYPPSGEVQRRYGVVDLGTTNPVASTLVSNGVTIPISDAKIWNGSQDMPNGVVTGYVAVLPNERYFTGAKVWTIRLSTGAGGILMSDPAWAGKTVAQIKEMLSGVYLVYPLATPTTETAEGYEQYQICDPSGTEEYVTTSIVPVGHETRYPHDLKKKIETAPDSPSADGTYLMKRSGGKNTYMALPSTPSSNGSYVLTVTVSGGTASYSWTAKE